MTDTAGGLSVMWRNWLLDRLLERHVELIDAQATAEDLRAALAYETQKHVVERDLLDARRDIEQWQPFARGICALQFRCYGRLSSFASGRTLASLDMLK